jgi:hypothetical protein
VLFKTVILVPGAEVRECEEFLNGKGEDQVDTFRTFSGKFENGFEVDIKVCQGDPPFVDPVLFEDGCEVAIGEVTGTLLGTYRFKLGVDEYMATVAQNN